MTQVKSISIVLNSLHLHNYLAGIYLNTQEAGTKCRKFDLYSCLCKVTCTRNLPNTSIL